LTIVDDGEYDEEWDEDPEEGLGDVDSMECEPTPAEALVLNNAPASRGRGAIAPRPPRAGRRGRNEGAQVSFSLTGRAGRTGELPEPSAASSSSSAIPSESVTLVNDAAGRQLCDVWIPDWATFELHERTLDEVQIVEAMYADEWNLLTPVVRAHLEDCVQGKSVSAQVEPLCLEVFLHIDGGFGGVDLAVEFSLPPYYPTHAGSILLRQRSHDGVKHRALERLEAELRSHVSDDDEGSEVMIRALEWLHQRGPSELARIEKEASETSSVPAPPPASASPSKSEKIEEARRERLTSKFSSGWDLCYAFSQHGKCKNKNCEWRHEAPGKGKKEPSDGAAAAAADAAATNNASPPTAAQQASSSQKAGKVGKKKR